MGLPGPRITATQDLPSSLHSSIDQPSSGARPAEPADRRPGSPSERPSDRLVDHLSVRIDEPATGAWNMALDEALMESARRGIVTLRFYAWEPHCLSLGRNQRTPRPNARDLRPGEDVVRRPTGGRSVYHGPELTYSLTAPDRFHGGPRAIYIGVNRAIRRGLVAVGAAIDAPADPTTARPGTAPLGSVGCFRDPAPGELTARGRKLVGSAQWRHAGAILQHGSILLHNRQERGTLEGVDLETGKLSEAGGAGGRARRGGPPSDSRSCCRGRSTRRS